MFAHVGQPAIAGKMAMPGILFPGSILPSRARQASVIGVGATRAVFGSEGKKK